MELEKACRESCRVNDDQENNCKTVRSYVDLVPVPKSLVNPYLLILGQVPENVAAERVRILKTVNIRGIKEELLAMFNIFSETLIQSDTLSRGYTQM